VKTTCATGPTAMSNAALVAAGGRTMRSSAGHPPVDQRP
jgi:hypothetical protein